jgi:pyruvate/2-oxoglutarate dehydrogenase complex dihydrolipoamide acyltransferase (E2) component
MDNKSSHAPTTETGRAGDQSLDYAERWMRDSLDVLRPAFAAHQITVDMTGAMQRLDDLRRRGVTATPTHLLVHAAARTLADNPDLHVLVSGSRRHRPARVDIGLSITGEIFVAPVLVIEGADRKGVEEIAAEIAQRVPQVRQADQQMLAGLRRWGWLVPFGFLRRPILRALFASPGYRRKVAGTFQISVVPVDWALTSTFVAAGVLIGGQVRSRVVPFEGQVVIRPTMILTLSGDHSVWDGRAAARFLAGVRSQLETVEPLASSGRSL